MEFLAAGALLLAILMIAIAARLGRARASSAARVAALQALVAEAANGNPPASSPAPSEMDDFAQDDWDFKLRAEAPPELPAPALVATAPSNRFVVNIPDASSGPRYQVSFERGRN